MTSFHISDGSGHITLGPLGISWGNAIDDLPGFFVLSWWDRCLEFGDIDAGNGIWYTRWEDGEVAVQKALVRLPIR